MIKSQPISAVIVEIFIVVSTTSVCRTAQHGSVDYDTISGITTTNQEPQELMFLDSDSNRLDVIESRLNFLFEELVTLKKSLRCIQCETETQKEIPSPSFKQPAAPELIIGRQQSAAGRRRLWARQAAGTRTQANFLRGEPGKSGLDGVPGLDGAPGLDGIPGIDGRNGKDGRDGLNGKDGRNGIDGQPGERGPPGPPGPPGDMGRRGKPGPQGLQGPPGPAGVCAYKSKYDCSLLSSSSSANQSDIILMAPVMVGQSVGGRRYEAQNADSGSSSAAGDEDRQVFVNEGEHIQLSCEASGQPRPDYVWRRRRCCSDDGSKSDNYNNNNKQPTILLDPAANLKVTSFHGGQLPLINVDRLQSGSYECLASNGVPPEASKLINLNVNYAPTIRLSPGPSLYRVELGSSLLIECIVDANPSPLSYWMFGSNLIMSIPQQQQPGIKESSSSSSGSGGSLLTGADRPPDQKQKYIITESTGQLAIGSSYTILTLNITAIGRQDLGVYKCLSKNLIGQSVGYALVESPSITKMWPPPFDESEPSEQQRLLKQQQPPPPSSSSSSSSSSSAQEKKDKAEEEEIQTVRELILKRSCSWADSAASIEEGWPSYLLERDPSANYSIFGNERRQQARREQASSMGSKRLVDELLGDLRNITRTDGSAIGRQKSAGIMSMADAENSIAISNPGKAIATEQPVVAQHHLLPKTRGEPSMMSSSADGLDDNLCRIEKIFSRASSPEATDSMEARKTSVWLLDQVGKPIYVGSAQERAINWWSLDARLQQQPQQQQQQFYATLWNITDRLFEYDSQADLLKDPSEPNAGHGSRAYELKYPIYGQSHLVYNGCFIYTTLGGTELGGSKQPTPPSKRGTGKMMLSNLNIVMLDLRTNEYSHVNWTAELRELFELQPLELSVDTQEYKMSRIEICSDENGVWLIIPTTTIDYQQQNNNKNKASLSSETSSATLKRRRLHVIKISSPLFEDASSAASSSSATTDVGSVPSIEIEYHTSIKLDWSMIGQMFIIDSVLYGIKDRHLYSSKLQFAYDLYKCKLISSEYLNEPHRTFTNHFGSTQMINYHPNEPKRLYTIDNGNLLWCPVKLIKTNPNNLWQ